MLALNPFNQKSDCLRVYCLKIIGLYYKEITENCKTDEEIYFNNWTLKQNLNHQQLLNLISDRTHLL